MAALSAKVAATRASIARRTQSYPSDHPKVLEARRDHAEAKLADYIERVLSAAPPLSDEQRGRLVDLLRPVHQSADRRTVVVERLAELDGGVA